MHYGSKIKVIFIISFIPLLWYEKSHIPILLISNLSALNILLISGNNTKFPHAFISAFVLKAIALKWKITMLIIKITVIYCFACCVVMWYMWLFSYIIFFLNRFSDCFKLFWVRYYTVIKVTGENVKRILWCNSEYLYAFRNFTSEQSVYLSGLLLNGSTLCSGK